MTENKLEQIEDETEENDVSAPVHYEITSYGVDFDVDGIVRRMEREDILIPPFQRNFVWDISQSSRFIESLLLGLPVPGIFLAQEQKTNKLLVIDGQQRLKTLQFFYRGFFNPSIKEEKQQIFKLSGRNIIDKYKDLRYNDLTENDKRTLGNTTIHATVVKQDSPSDDDTSIYHIYERLNSSGRLLNPQEIRCAVYHGELIELIDALNEYKNWRDIFGKKSNRLKDQEFILRFFTMFFSETEKEYKPPMLHFINVFTKKHREPSEEFINNAMVVFEKTIDIFYSALGKKAFRKQGSSVINAAIFDSMMYGLGHRIKNGNIPNIESIKSVHDRLLKDSEYDEAISHSTAGRGQVLNRLKKARIEFSKI